ncbi:MAG TPA: RAMP superfamily CRISPR-associated protein [Terriglobia bacterium]|nr:RAMP superfamily CRISPR-associated protein [Terriglobia bacterium]
MSMQKLEYQLRFLTPAFLGNAEQNGQWRTPPFKALLRQWWRVVKAPQVGYDRDALKLKKEEAELFGSAADTAGSGSGRSRVVVRLDSWKNGTMNPKDQNKWQAGGKVHHPEVGNGGREIDAALYLGYGPLNFEKGKGTVAQRTAIAPVSENARLALLVQESDFAELQRTMQLIAHFGTLGSRSRNGWGSLELQPDKDTPAFEPLTRSNLERWNVCRPLAECLQLDWPHAIGRDEKGPLVWRLNPQNNWQAAIQQLAEIKIKVRTQPKDLSLDGKKDGEVVARHVLGYPLTNHAALGPINLEENEAGWVALDPRRQPKKDKRGMYIQSARLASQLRFKVVVATAGKFQGMIFHLPCKVPDALIKKLSPNDQNFIRNKELAVWKAVHATLDNNARRIE